MITTPLLDFKFIHSSIYIQLYTCMGALLQPQKCMGCILYALQIHDGKLTVGMLCEVASYIYA